MAKKKGIITMSIKFKKKWRKIGRALRITLFILNGSIWVQAVLAIIGSMLVGFYTRSLIFDYFDLYDFTLSTPTTIIFYYGIIIVSVTMVGCFVGTGGRIWACATYCVLLFILALFDNWLGVRLFYIRAGLMNFLEQIHKSMYQYQTNSNSTIGLFGTNVDVYWDHMQRQMHCCGLFGWEEWKNTPIGKTFDLPDSCCNDRYVHIGCGSDLLRHPDNEEHRTEDVIHTKSCVEAYPKRYLKSFTEASSTGIFIAIELLICFLLSLVLLVLNITRIYQPGKNIYPPPKKGENKKTLLIDPTTEKPNTELILPEDDDDGSYPKFNKAAPRIFFKKNNQIEPDPDHVARYF